MTPPSPCAPPWPSPCHCSGTPGSSGCIPTFCRIFYQVRIKHNPCKKKIKRAYKTKSDVKLYNFQSKLRLPPLYPNPRLMESSSHRSFLFFCNRIIETQDRLGSFPLLRIIWFSQFLMANTLSKIQKTEELSYCFLFSSNQTHFNSKASWKVFDILVVLGLQITLNGSIWSTVIVAVERYVSVGHPSQRLALSDAVDGSEIKTKISELPAFNLEVCWKSVIDCNFW